MKFYTSYYSSPLLDREKHFLVQVSNSAPKGFVPDWKFVEAIPDWDTIVKPYKDGVLSATDYVIRYRRQLDARAFALVLNLEGIVTRAAGKDVVFLCYEKSGAFCHRGILAQWFAGEKSAEAILFADIDMIEELGSGELSLF